MRACMGSVSASESSSLEEEDDDGNDVSQPPMHYHTDFYYLKNTLRVGLHGLKYFSGTHRHYILNYATLHVSGHESVDAVLGMLAARNPGLVAQARACGWCLAGLSMDDGTVAAPTIEAALCSRLLPEQYYRTVHVAMLHVALLHAFAQGLHPRCGRESMVLGLHDDVMRSIVAQFFRPPFVVLR